MKAIKKVEVTPLDYNEGKIIDSASSTDDKTKNTYSMRIVDQKLDTKANSSTTYTKTEVDAAIDNLDDTKVDKAGDTLTGALNFQNTDTFTAFEKTRTLYDQEQEPFDVKVAVGVGANSSSVIENWLDDDLMTRLELRPNGEIWNATANSKVVERGDFAIITGSMTLDANSTESLNDGKWTQTGKNISYPTGFTSSNCVPISIGLEANSTNGMAYGYSSGMNNTIVMLTNAFPRTVNLTSSNVVLRVGNFATESKSVNYKIVLMKIS